ncbi:MAG TPA: Uma2 family endonuclease [Herpetosiphonaceae bacterium]
METRAQATLDDLYHVPEHGKAELIDGEIVPMSPTGDAPNRAAGAIYVRLRMYEPHTNNGRAYADNAGFSVDLPHRNSFSPDAAFYFGKATGLKFLEGAPVFAAEVRSEGDYGPKAERAIAQKIADYFAAGTLVVWDVDLLAEEVIKVYRASDPATPTIYHRGDVAEAEPAVPGWTMPVDELFT